jgi:hypothetical protein
MNLRARLSLPLLAVVALTGCGDAVERLSPRYFYGYVTAADADQLCLGDARQGAPERERCFEVDAVPDGVQEGSLVRVRYERDGDRDVAVDVTPHGRG